MSPQVIRITVSNEDVVIGSGGLSKQVPLLILFTLYINLSDISIISNLSFGYLFVFLVGGILAYSIWMHQN